jgi:hypothetical protein
MRQFTVGVIACLLACTLGSCTSSPTTKPSQEPAAPLIRLGNFSISLAVKDLAASRAFYENLGFRARGGDPTKNWLVLQNETSTIGSSRECSTRTR